ncbi:MAG: UDP-N-acetylmuramate--L-alanine ligase [Candidatus Delongbacteria bacterium]|jgi:UDP-N-acetylmuramate--alanine ligase|nr:UDP-N-acetylmuramate--L-alanine ligase [Candidatus Delongbacteria bacterium]
MMNIKNDIKNIYLIGIGGIGMSALARYFLQKGKWVAGYDRTYSYLTSQLEDEGAVIHYDDGVEMIPDNIKADKNSLVIYTPAIPDTNLEKRFFMQSGHRLMKRAEVLGELSRAYNTIAVAGTHGKTTISTMLAHLLQYNKNKAHAFLGGISLNYNSNYINGRESGLMVVEADEFDRSFLQLQQTSAIVTMVDADHLDIYNNKAMLTAAFNEFISKTPQHLLIRYDTATNINAKSCYTYDLFNEKADFYVSRFRQNGMYYRFDLHTPEAVIENLDMGVPGRLNLENMVAAAAMAFMYGVNARDIREAVADFKGIKRRFEIVLHTRKVVYIDDYAHHPEEIKRTLHAVRTLFPGKKIAGVFQPHLYSRTRDFADGFASALETLDVCLILPIYPARELPIPGVNSDLILKKMQHDNARIITKKELPDYLKSHKPDILITLGAGDIDRLIDPIKAVLSE